MKKIIGLYEVVCMTCLNLYVVTDCIKNNIKTNEKRTNNSAIRPGSTFGTK